MPIDEETSPVAAAGRTVAISVTSSGTGGVGATPGAVRRYGRSVELGREHDEVRKFASQDVSSWPFSDMQARLAAAIKAAPQLEGEVLPLFRGRKAHENVRGWDIAVRGRVRTRTTIEVVNG